MSKFKYGDVVEVQGGFYKGLIGIVLRRKRFFWTVVQCGSFPFSVQFFTVATRHLAPHMRKPEHRLLATLRDAGKCQMAKELFCTKSTLEQLEAELESAEVVRVVEQGEHVRIFGMDIKVDDRVASHPSGSRFVAAELIDFGQE